MCLAIPGKIVAIDAADTDNPIGRIDFGGIVRPISLAFVPEAGVGDHVIVHAGFALSLIDEAEASASLNALRELGGGQ